MGSPGYLGDQWAHRATWQRTGPTGTSEPRYMSARAFTTSRVGSGSSPARAAMSLRSGGRGQGSTCSTSQMPPRPGHPSLGDGRRHGDRGRLSQRAPSQQQRGSRGGLGDRGRARFVSSDVYKACRALGGEVSDIVYVSLGSLCWLPDASRPGPPRIDRVLGAECRFYIHDVHPLALAALENLSLRLRQVLGQAASWPQLTKETSSRS